MNKEKKLVIEESKVIATPFQNIKRVGPLIQDATYQSETDIDTEAIHKNRAWISFRKIKIDACDEQTIPSWTGFNIITRDIDVTKDKIGYLPTMNFPVTSSTAIEIIENALVACKRLD